MGKRTRFVLIGLSNFILFVLLVSIPIFWGNGTQFVSADQQTYSPKESVTFTLTNMDLTQCGCSEAPFILQRFENNTWQTLPFIPSEERVCLNDEVKVTNKCETAKCKTLSNPIQQQTVTWDQNLIIPKYETEVCDGTEEPLPVYTTVKVKKGEYRAVFGGNSAEFTIE